MPQMMVVGGEGVTFFRARCDPMRPGTVAGADRRLPFATMPGESLRRGPGGARTSGRGCAPASADHGGVCRSLAGGWRGRG